MKIGYIAILRPNLLKFLISGQDLQFQISYLWLINNFDLLWLSNCIALGIYFIFGTKFSWNEGIDICINVECVLLGRNVDSLGGYCSLPSGYCLLLLVTWWLLVVTARYWWLLLVPTFSMNVLYVNGIMLKLYWMKYTLLYIEIKLNAKLIKVVMR